MNKGRRSNIKKAPIKWKKGADQMEKGRRINGKGARNNAKTPQFF